MFNKNDYVFHKREGIMFVEDVVVRNFGNGDTKYLILKLPYSFDSITMALPFDNPLLRKPRSKKEMLKIIDSFKKLEDVWILDNKTRKETFNAIIDSDDTYKIACIANSIQKKRAEFAELKKPLPLQDSKIYDVCKKLIHEEIAYALEMEYSKVEEYLSKKLS